MNQGALGLGSLAHGNEVLVQLLKMLVEVTVLHCWVGRRHVNPEIKDTVLSLTVFTCLVYESIMEVPLDVADYVSLSVEVTEVPLLIALTLVLFKTASVLKELVEELNRENFDLIQGFELTHIHVCSLRDV